MNSGEKRRVQTQISAGGVAYRHRDSEVEVALISVGSPARWQLPKGLVDSGESPEQAAVREVHEEAGLETELIAPIEVIEYWYADTHQGRKVRFHKFVHFFLLAYRSGDTADHDHEVHEARRMPIAEARTKLAFPSERKVLERAEAMIAERMAYSSEL